MFNTRTPAKCHQMSIGRAGFTVLARGNTPLHLAAKYGCTEAVKALLEAKASVAAKNNDGRGAFGGFVDLGVQPFEAVFSFFFTAC